jgi:hypothetical protein
MEWIIALLRRLVSYEARAAAITQDRLALMKDIGNAINTKEKRISKLEQQIESLEKLVY